MMMMDNDCLLRTLELFVSINDGDELRSTRRFISVVDDDVSFDVFSPLVEQIADNVGDKRF